MCPLWVRICTSKIVMLYLFLLSGFGFFVPDDASLVKGCIGLAINVRVKTRITDILHLYGETKVHRLHARLSDDHQHPIIRKPPVLTSSLREEGLSAPPR